LSNFTVIIHRAAINKNPCFWLNSPAEVSVHQSPDNGRFGNVRQTQFSFTALQHLMALNASRIAHGRRFCGQLLRFME
jgi:hypothetical protein